ncbi:hypothetical protein AVEN_115171-1 [Araneus ventricosus]|uniref:Uncharacterized protein n=1 Tax=Araneus ventricosus TaxID=182803 RepID=A0A4Y1ZYP9_ARAVE|nr:hypothetical protein AVEN_115171-1 [Araneus ventricosus]
MKQPPDATSSSDSDPDFSPSPRPQTYGLRPSRGSIPRTLISPPTTFLLTPNRTENDSSFLSTKRPWWHIRTALSRGFKTQFQPKISSICMPGAHEIHRSQTASYWHGMEV